MTQTKTNSFLKDLLADLVGGSMIAVGLYNFAATAQFPMVGFNGIALIFYQLFGWPIGITAMLLNVPVIFFTYRILGHKFFLNSLRTILISSVLIDFVAPLFPVYSGDKLLAAICCGILSGLGYAIIYMHDSSTGGADFITLSIRAKNPHISLGHIAFIMDAVIVTLGTILVSRDVDNLIYGFIISYLLSIVVDKVMYGINEGKVALIVTEHGHEVCLRIDEVLGRGSTILKGVGSYSKQHKDVVMCACNNKEMYGIRKLIKEIDEKSFLVIMESNEVVGEGFLEK